MESSSVNRKKSQIEGNRSVYEQAMKQLRGKRDSGDDLDMQERKVLAVDKKERIVRKKAQVKKSKEGVSNVFGSSIKQLQKEKRAGEYLDKEEKRALKAKGGRGRISVSDTYARAKEMESLEKDRLESQKKKTIEEFIEVNKRNLEKRGSRKERRMDDKVNKLTKDGKTGLPKRHSLRKALSEEVAERKKEIKKPLEGAELLQSELHEALQEFENRVESYLLKVQASGERLTPETRKMAIKSVSPDIAEAIELVNAKITVELKKFENEEEVTEEERSLERLAGRAYQEMDRFDRLAEGEEAELPDPSEYESDVALLSSDDEVIPIVPTMSDAFLEEDPAILAAQKRDRERVVPVMPEAFLQEDPAILEAQRREVEKLEQETVEIKDFDPQSLITTQELEGEHTIPVNLFKDATLRAEGFSFEGYPQKVIDAVGPAPQIEMSAPAPRVRVEGTSLLENEETKDMIQRISNMKRVIRELYGVPPEGDLIRKVASESRKIDGRDVLMEGREINEYDFAELWQLETKMETVKNKDALFLMAKRDADKYVEYRKLVASEGQELSAYDAVGIADALEKFYRFKSEYNDAAVDLNTYEALLIYNKDVEKGMRVYYTNMLSSIESAKKVKELAMETLSFVQKWNERGEPIFSPDIAPALRRRLNYLERRAENLVVSQERNPYSGDSLDGLHLKTLHSEVLLMKVDLNDELMRHDTDRLIERNGLGESLKGIVKEFETEVDASQILEAISIETGQKYRIDTEGVVFDKEKIDKEITRLEVEQDALIDLFNEKKEELVQVSSIKGDFTQALQNLNFDIYGSRGTWLNENVFSWKNQWDLRRSINTGGATESEITAIQRVVYGNELFSDLVSEGTLEQVRNGNVSNAATTELIRAQRELGEIFLKKDEELHQTRTEALALIQVLEELRAEEMYTI